MWFAVYQTEDGRLVSICTEPANPLPEGLSLLTCTEDMPDAGAWDLESRSFITE